MLNSVKKPITTSAFPTFDERYAPALEASNDPAQLLAQYHMIYETTHNPSIPLAVLCTAVDAAGDAEYLELPAWAGRLLAEGFSQYIDAVASGDRTVSLEQCLGIRTAGKGNIADLTTLDEMAGRVHRLRWLFGLKVGVACHVVYLLHIEQSKSLGLTPDKVGITRSEDSFQQYYHDHAKQFPAWQAERESQGDTPTSESRTKILSMLPPDLAGRVAREAKIPT